MRPFRAPLNRGIRASRDLELHIPMPTANPVHEGPGAGEDGEDIPILCMACDDHGNWQPNESFSRRAVGPLDVLVDLRYCGVCQSDVFVARTGQQIGEDVRYPFVAGHEMTGVCTAVGPEVTKFKLGDHVGIGVFVDSCGSCDGCGERDESQCRVKPIQSYGMTPSHTAREGKNNPHPQTVGGTSSHPII